MTQAIVDEIVRERERQETLRRSGKFLWTCASPDVATVKKLAVLAEEFGEASRAATEEMIALDKGRPEDAAGARLLLREELVQVAAVCLAWLESLTEASPHADAVRRNKNSPHDCPGHETCNMPHVIRLRL
jgi:hypothetical protein